MAFSSATHRKTSAPLLPWNRYGSCPQGSKLLGSIEVRGEGSALGQRQGLAMWQRSRLWGDLFNRLLEKLGTSGCPLSPFPSPSSITWDLGFIQSCYKNSLLEAQGFTRYLSIPLDASLPKRGSMHVKRCWLGKSSFLTGDGVMRPTPLLTLV